MIRALRGYGYIAPEPFPHPRDARDPNTIDPELLERMTEGRIPATAGGGFEIDPDTLHEHVGTPGIPSIKSEDIKFGLGGRPAYSPPRTLNNDAMPITPQQLELMTRGRVPATVPHGGVMSPDQYMRHSVPRPSGERASISPHPDNTSAMRLATLLQQSQRDY